MWPWVLEKQPATPRRGQKAASKPSPRPGAIRRADGAPGGNASERKQTKKPGAQVQDTQQDIPRPPAWTMLIGGVR